MALKKYIFTQSIAPFSNGELPLQHYNNLLCMSHLHEFVDCISLFQNDDVMSIIEKMSNDSLTAPSVTTKTQLLPFNHSKLKSNASSSNDKQSNSVTLDLMNDYIIKCLLNLILPVDNVSLRSQSFGLELYEIQRFLCSNPNLKIVEIYNVMSNNSALGSSNYGNAAIKSNPLLKKLFSLVPKYKSNTSEQFTSLNSLLISRGAPHDSTEYNTKAVISQLWQEFDLIKKSLQPVKWNPFTIDLWSSSKSFNETSNASSNNGSAQKIKTNSLTVCLNRNKCVEYLKEVVSKSKEKYAVKAYVHWYEKFNINNDHFQRAFENVNTIIDFYDQMTR